MDKYDNKRPELSVVCRFTLIDAARACTSRDGEGLARTARLPDAWRGKAGLTLAEILVALILPEKVATAPLTALMVKCL